MVISMSTKLSRLYGMDIFTDSGKFIGNAQDFIVDLESGEVSRILIEPLPAGKEDARKALREKSIMYKNVKSVEDVIVVSKGPAAH
jgi:sporulation protein YlmC with PRC-barrel domain